MTTYIALLRGINVSGSNLIRMNALKMSMERIGLVSVKTYIQSGNLVFRYLQIAHSELENLLSYAIQNDFSCKVPVLVKTAKELERAIQENPFVSERKLSSDTLHITFLNGKPDCNLLQGLLPLNDGIDEGLVAEDRIYLNCPQGYGKTRFTNSFFEKKLKLTATTRNLRTLLKLIEMTTSE